MLTALADSGAGGERARERAELFWQRHGAYSCIDRLSLYRVYLLNL